MKASVRSLVEDFEAGRLSETDVLKRLQEITGRSIDSYYLRNYWRSESIDDLVDKLCAKTIKDWQAITEAEAEELICEYIVTESPGRRDSIEVAIDRRFGKASGFLSDLVFQRDIDDPKAILSELKKDTVIYL